MIGDSRFGLLLSASRFGAIRRNWRLAIRARGIRDSTNSAWSTARILALRKRPRRGAAQRPRRDGRCTVRVSAESRRTGESRAGRFCPSAPECPSTEGPMRMLFLQKNGLYTRAVAGPDLATEQASLRPRPPRGVGRRGAPCHAVAHAPVCQ